MKKFTLRFLYALGSEIRVHYSEEIAQNLANRQTDITGWYNCTYERYSNKSPGNGGGVLKLTNVTKNDTQPVKVSLSIV